MTRGGRCARAGPQQPRIPPLEQRQRHESHEHREPERREAHEDHRGRARGRRHVPELLHLALERRLGDPQPTRHRHERTGQRARRVEERREPHARRLAEAPAGRPTARCTRATRRRSRGSSATTRFDGRTSVARLSYASWSFGPMRRSGPGSRLDARDERVRQAPAGHDHEKREDRGRAEPSPNEAPGEAERTEDDEHDDADDVGHPLGDDDGGRARDRYAVGLEEDQRLEDLADLAGRDRQHEAAEEREQAVDLRPRPGCRGARGRTPT